METDRKLARSALDFPCTDTGNAEWLLVLRPTLTFRWLKEQNDVPEGEYWVERLADGREMLLSTSEVLRWAIESVRQRQAEATARAQAWRALDKETRQALADEEYWAWVMSEQRPWERHRRWAEESESYERLSALLLIAQGLAAWQPPEPVVQNG